MNKGEKQPRDHVYCPRCDRPYGYIRFRYTNSKGENMCGNCGAIERGEITIAESNEQKREDKQTPTNLQIEGLV